MGPKIDRDGGHSDYRLAMVITGTDEDTLHVCVIGDPFGGNMLPDESRFICLSGAQENRGEEEWVIGNLDYSIDPKGVPQKGSIIMIKSKDLPGLIRRETWRRVSGTENADEMRKAAEMKQGWQDGQ